VYFLIGGIIFGLAPGGYRRSRRTRRTVTPADA
jgi:uncharacterized membrane protein YesL